MNAQGFLESFGRFCWFDVNTHIECFEPKSFPIFIWESQGDKQIIHGFPAIDGKDGGVKVTSEQYETSTTADTVERDVIPEEIKAMYGNRVAPCFPESSGNCIKAVSCLYTVTPDSHFLIDQHPKYPSIILTSACSGHGFKHSAFIGEILAELVIDGESEIDISSFKLNRF